MQISQSYRQAEELTHRKTSNTTQNYQQQHSSTKADCTNHRKHKAYLGRKFYVTIRLLSEIKRSN